MGGRRGRFVDWDSEALKIQRTMSWTEISATRLQTLTLHGNDVNSVAFSRNHDLASGSSDKKACISKWEKGKGYTPTLSLKEHKYSITCVDFSPYGSIFATSSVDGTVVLWDVSTGHKLTSFVQPGNAAIRVCNFSAHSTLLLTAGDSGSVNVWDVSTRKLQSTFQHGEDAIYGACFSPCDTYIVSGCSAGLLHLWNGSGGHNKPLSSYENAHDDGGITCISFAPTLISSDGGLGKLCLMVTGGQDHLVKLWNIAIGLYHDIELLRVLDGHSAAVFCTKIAYGGLIASASSDKTVRLWNLNGRCLKILEGHERYVTSCAFSSDGKLLSSGSNDKTVIVWDLSGTVNLNEDLKCSNNEYSLNKEEIWPQYEKLCKSKMHQGKHGPTIKATFEVSKADFNSCLIIDRLVVASASSSKSLFSWDLDSLSPGGITSSVCSHKYSVNSIAYCPQLDILASASTDGTINLLRVADKKLVGTLQQPSGVALRTCRFSSEGLLIAAGDDEKASLWNAKSSTFIKQFEEHEAAIYATAFSPCGQYVATGCSDGQLKLWECEGETNINSICTQKCAHELGVTTCDFSPKGLGGTRGQHRLLMASGGNDSLIKLWQVTIDVRQPISGNFSLWQTFNDHGTGTSVMSVQFSPSGTLLAGAGGMYVRLWDVGSSTCIQVIEGHKRYVTGVAFAAGSLLVSCSGDHTVKVWELHDVLSDESAPPENVAIENMISKWSSEDIVNWLAEIGLGDLGHIFEAASISGKELVILTETTLHSQLGIEEEAVRKQLLTELQWLKSLGINSKKRVSPSHTITAPQEFFCPITHDIFAEPVISADGQTYERAAITEWFLTGKTTSPLTNVELSSLSLTPNFELQNRISEFLAQRLNAS